MLLCSRSSYREMRAALRATELASPADAAGKLAAAAEKLLSILASRGHAVHAEVAARCLVTVGLSPGVTCRGREREMEQDSPQGTVLGLRMGMMLCTAGRCFQAGSGGVKSAWEIGGRCGN